MFSFSSINGHKLTNRKKITLTNKLILFLYLILFFTTYFQLSFDLVDSFLICNESCKEIFMQTTVKAHYEIHLTEKLLAYFTRLAK